MRKRFEKGGERVFDRTEHSHLIRAPGAIPVCHIPSHFFTSGWHVVMARYPKNTPLGTIW